MRPRVSPIWMFHLHLQLGQSSNPATSRLLGGCVLPGWPSGADVPPLHLDQGSGRLQQSQIFSTTTNIAHLGNRFASACLDAIPSQRGSEKSILESVAEDGKDVQR